MKLKVVERDYNLLGILNFSLFVLGWWLSDKVHPRWEFAIAASLIFLLLNYKVMPANAANQPAVKRRKPLYYSVSFWWLVAFAGYSAYVLLHTGWVFWFLFLAGIVGAGIATVRRLWQAQAS